MAGIIMADPGFGRGQTLGVSDVAQGASVTGTQKTFLDQNPHAGKAGEFLSNRAVTCIAVRNASGAAILPGTAVKFKSDDLLNSVDGNAATGAGLVGIADEYLPATGVADKDVFWVVVSGPTAIATAATLAAGVPVTATAGKAAAGDPTKPTEIVGYAIGATKDGKVRTLVGVKSEHSA